MGKHYVIFTIEDSKTLKHRKDLMGKRKEVQDLYSGLNMFKKLAVSPWIMWFISSAEKSTCCQTWANSQDDNYFSSKSKCTEMILYWNWRPVFTAMCCQRARSRSFGAKFVYVSRWLYIAVKTGCPQRPAVTAMWIQCFCIAVKIGLWR